MSDLSDLQAAQTIKIAGANSSGTETNFVNADANGNINSTLPSITTEGSAIPSSSVLIGADDGINLHHVQIRNISPSGSEYGLVVRNIPKVRETYSATAFGIVPAASATDVFTITGSESKTIYIHKIQVSGTRTAHAHNQVILLKRSTANSGGTSTTRTAVPHDSTNAAATATVTSYTANPTLGTLVGELASNTLSLPVQTPSNAQGNGGSVTPWLWEFTSIGQPLVLRGTSQVLSINFNSVTITGGNLNFSIEWSEE